MLCEGCDRLHKAENLGYVPKSSMKERQRPAFGYRGFTIAFWGKARLSVCHKNNDKLVTGNVLTCTQHGLLLTSGRFGYLGVLFLH